MKNPFPHDLDDWNEYRGMVHWLSPTVLLQTLNRLLPSTLFGQYADRRLVHAALDSPLNDWAILKECFGGKKGVCRRRKTPEIWLDYVADLGDGFDSTYAIAYLIGQQAIHVDGNDLPRADCLVMGGDEVYPYASREDYKKRMERPYKASFPKNKDRGTYHPPLFLIPGNHDWYDGLTLFLAKFGNGRKDNYLGSWVARQRRSYFAAHLGDNWWIWGFDSQLGEDVDQPQADYFEFIARKMQPNAKIILCASVPTWLRANLTAKNKEEQETFYRGLDYIAGIVRRVCRGAKIPLVLSGDLHHYSRYVEKGAGTNFINAGGGGAFLHPTHDSIDDSIQLKWAGIEQTLDIGLDAADSTKKAVYPKPEDSRRLALGNFGFWYQNWDFCLLLGGLYWVCALLMLAWNAHGEAQGTGPFWPRVLDQGANLLTTPMFVLVLLAFLGILIGTADIRSKIRKVGAGGLHALVHLIVLVVGMAFVSVLISPLKAVYLLGDILYFFSLMGGMVLFGFLGGFWWGAYLALVSWFWGEEANSAFSAMRLDSYKHFIRMKIQGDEITVYPVRLDEAPPRSIWKFNEAYDGDNTDPNVPAIIPKTGLGQKLIEKEIVVNINDVVPLESV